MENLEKSMGQVAQYDLVVEGLTENTEYEMSSGALVECVADNGDLLTVRTYGGNDVVVKREGYILRGSPTFHAGDEVVIVSDGRTAAVAFVQYHFKRKCFYYTLDIAGKRSSKWYFDDDLMGAEQGGLREA